MKGEKLLAVYFDELYGKVPNVVIPVDLINRQSSISARLYYFITYPHYEQ